MRGRARLLVGLGIAASTVCAFIACVGDDPDGTVGPNADSGSSQDGTGNLLDTGGGADTGGGSDAGAGDDAADANDGALLPLTTLPSVSAGYNYSCALRQSGKIYCWGDNRQGNLGNGLVDDGGAGPGQVSTIITAARIGSGGATCALLTDHTVWCWGANSIGAAGQPIATTKVSTPLQVPGMTNVMEIAVGGNFTCARKADKTVWCWGGNEVDQLGHDNSLDAACVIGVPCDPAPKQVAGLAADAIAAGSFHACARVGNKAHCWGSNRRSQLGHAPGSNNDVTVNGFSANPVPVEAAATNVTNVFAGAEMSCTIDGSSVLSCWGEDKDGELGDNGTAVTSSTPIVIAGLGNDVRRVAGSMRNICAVRGFELWCWGSGLFGAMGTSVDAGPEIYPATRILNPNKSWQDIAGAQGNVHHCALGADSTVWCWGGNDRGQLGHLPSSDPDCNGSGFRCNPTPIQVQNLP
jgi:alpha-tubulin suppressor-like RCC1 family protein